MNTILLTQIKWMKAFNGMAPEWLNHLLAFVNYLDGFAFYSTVAIIVWMGFRKQRGVELIVLSLISFAFCVILKQFYRIPRPFIVDPSVGLVHVGGYSFPSGAAQTAMIWGGYFFYQARGCKLWQALAVLYILFMSIARVYIGVHYPTDILMGWFSGGVVLALYILFGEKAYQKSIKWTPHKRFAVLALFALLPALLFFNSSVWLCSSILLGLFLGLYLNDQCKLSMENPHSTGERWLRIVVSLVQMVLLVGVFSWMFKTSVSVRGFMHVVTFIIGVWISFVMQRINAHISRMVNN